MRCPTLAELPPPPDGRIGWPWTAESVQLPARRPDGTAWPRISIVTPSYNQGQFIEETIRSVLLQGYPNLEYVIIDGGSKDQSLEIIKKYEPWLSDWVSETDRGQVHAINKGLSISKGELFQWINSDDCLLPNALQNIGAAYSGDAVAAAILIGPDQESAVVRPNRDLSPSDLVLGKTVLSQPGFWLPRAGLLTVGLDERRHYAFDWELAIKYLGKYPTVTYLNECVVFFRVHGASKSGREQDMFRKEGISILSSLVRSTTSPSERNIYKKGLKRRIWERHLVDWAARPGRNATVACRVLILGLRDPKYRMSRFWFGAVRRIFLHA